jgi:hypothetical protein
MEMGQIVPDHYDQSLRYGATAFIRESSPDAGFTGHRTDLRFNNRGTQDQQSAHLFRSWTGSGLISARTTIELRGCALQKGV